MSNRRIIIIAMALLGWFAISMRPAAAAEPQAAPPAAKQPPPPASLDDELLKDLETDLGDDLPATPPARPRRSGGATDQKPGQPSADPLSITDELLDEDALDNALLRELRSDFEPDDNDPLAKIGRAMREAEQLVGQAKSGEPTQQLQNKIVDDLDRLLEAARQRQQQSKSSQSQQSSSRQSASKQSQPGNAGGASDQPARDGSDSLRDRTAARPSPDEMKNLLRDLWGHLPEHERQMVINSTIERFLPKYELLIEAYFKRLAEESARK